MLKHIFLFCILFSLGCAKTTKSNDNINVLNDVKKFKNINLLSSKVIRFDTLLGAINGFKIIDSIGFIYNVGKSSLLTIVNINTGSIIGDCIGRGKANNELINDIGNVNIDKKSNKFGVWEFMSNTYLTYNLDSLLYNVNQNHAAGMIPMKRFRTNEYINNLVHINDSIYYATTMNFTRNSNRILVLNNSGEIIDMKSDYYPNNLDKETLYYAYQGHFAISYENEIFVIANCHTDLIEIYNFDGTIKAYSHGPFNIQPKVEKIINGNMRRVKSSSESRIAYSRPVIKDNKIWTIFNGEVKSRNKMETKQIITFDLNGNGDKIYTLEHPVDCFDVDENNKLIYAMEYESDVYTIYVYQYD